MYPTDVIKTRMQLKVAPGTAPPTIVNVRVMCRPVSHLGRQERRRHWFRYILPWYWCSSPSRGTQESRKIHVQ